MSFLLSSRDDFITDAIDHVDYTGQMSFRAIIGAGRYVLFRNPGDDFSRSVTLENDMFNYWFSYGFVGSFFFFIFIGFVLLKGLLYRNYYRLQYTPGFQSPLPEAGFANDRYEPWATGLRPVSAAHR